MSAIDQINQGGTTYEIVPEIAELFSIEKTYRAGDHVIYEAGWYTFKTDKYAGAWDATKVDGPFKVTNELSSLKSDLNIVAAKPKFRNGSVGNLSNENAISFEDIQEIPFDGKIKISIGIILANATNKFRVVLDTFSVKTGKTASNLSNRVSHDITYTLQPNEHLLEFDIEDGSVGFALTLLEIEADNTTVVPLRVANTGTKPVSVIAKQETEVDIYEPVIRNGSVGNTDNPNAIAFKYVEKRNNAYGMTLYLNKAPASGSHYRAQITTTNRTSGATPIASADRITNEKNYEFPIGATSVYIPFEDDSAGYAIAVYEINSDESFGTIRAFSNVYLYVKYNYISDVPMNYFFTPELKNGTTGNGFNTDGICFKTIKEKDGASGATYYINKKPTTGNHYRIVLTTYDVSSGNLPMSAEHRIINELNYDFPINASVIYTRFDDVSVGYAVSLLEVKPDNSFKPLRIGDAKITVCHDYEKALGGGKVITHDNLKKDLSVRRIYSYMEYNQSFCMYDGKYYTTDGSHIAEQNASFQLTRNVDLTVGHGNAFQLGSSHYAYISDWHNEDNNCKIYKVDLETLTLADTYILPITGYTTCVIDDLNNICYILQRDTSPSTVENYNFIVFDLSEMEIIKTRKVLPMIALQGMDYYNGKIIAAYGLGSDSNINGIVMFNTSGDVVAEYELDAIKTQEPEGVFINRSGGGIKFSTYNYILYELY